LQSFFLQIDKPKIIIHEADEPDAFVDFLDAAAGNALWIVESSDSPLEALLG
jgi:hypothetical protein